MEWIAKEVLAKDPKLALLLSTWIISTSVCTRVFKLFPLLNSKFCRIELQNLQKGKALFTFSLPLVTNRLVIISRLPGNGKLTTL